MVDSEHQEGSTRPFHIRCLFQYEDIKSHFPDLEVRSAVEPKEKDSPFKKPKRTSRQQKKKNSNVIDAEDIIPDKNHLNTGDYVDETMICFLPEFCERAGIKEIPRDPIDLCMSFSLLIPDCGALQE